MMKPQPVYALCCPNYLFRAYTQKPRYYRNLYIDTMKYLSQVWAALFLAAYAGYNVRSLTPPLLDSLQTAFSEERVRT